MSSYIVLKRKSPSKGSGIGTGPKFETLGAAGKGAWGITIEKAEPKHAAQISADPDVAMVARTMPTALIAPVDMGAPAPASMAAAQAPWGIAFVGADKTKLNGQDVVVAVLDTGIDAAHQAFAGIDLVEKDFSKAGNGDRQGHGTHCAGTIFGRDVDGVRIGIARGVERALIGKVLDDTGAGESEMIFDALTWAMQENADIISLSLGFDFPGLVGRLVSEGWPTDLATSTALESYRNNLRMFDAIMNILQANKNFGKEPLVVAAAGNESRREVDEQFRIAASLPAAALDVLSVAAVDDGGRVAQFSNSNSVVCAPGVDITSAWPGRMLNTISGTSMACPHVAGLAALWWQHQKLQGVVPTATNVKAKILATLRRDIFNPSFNELDFGQGLAVAPE